jgi:hypothetical protein
MRAFEMALNLGIRMKSVKDQGRPRVMRRRQLRGLTGESKRRPNAAGAAADVDASSSRAARKRPANTTRRNHLKRMSGDAGRRSHACRWRFAIDDQATPPRRLPCRRSDARGR